MSLRYQPFFRIFFQLVILQRPGRFFAMVDKLFYLVAAHEWMERGKLEDTDELRRAMGDMIVHSYNED